MVNKFGVTNFYIFLLLIHAMLSCGKKQTAAVKPESNTLAITDTIRLSPESPELANTPKENVVLSPSKEIIIDTFSTFPPEIDGCACYYSNNREQFDKKIFIYADNYNDNAFVSVGGELTKFTLSKVDTLPNKHSIQTWGSKKYELIIDIKRVGQIDETWQQQGTLKIKDKGGKEVLKSIYGECGC